MTTPLDHEDVRTVRSIASPQELATFVERFDRLDPDSPRRMKPKVNKPAKSGASYDACGTPWQGIAPLLPYLPMSSVIWECASGEGMMVDALKAERPYVVWSDYGDGVDFLTSTPPYAAYDLIVTNPP